MSSYLLLLATLAFLDVLAVASESSTFVWNLWFHIYRKGLLSLPDDLKIIK